MNKQELAAMVAEILSGMEHEPPVKAVLVFQVYRPRLPGAANPDTVGADKFAVEERPVGGNAGN